MQRCSGWAGSESSRVWGWRGSSLISCSSELLTSQVEEIELWPRLGRTRRRRSIPAGTATGLFCSLVCADRGIGGANWWRLTLRRAHPGYKWHTRARTHANAHTHTRSRTSPFWSTGRVRPLWSFALKLDLSFSQVSGVWSLDITHSTQSWLLTSLCSITLNTHKYIHIFNAVKIFQAQVKHYSLHPTQSNAILHKNPATHPTSVKLILNFWETYN